MECFSEIISLVAEEIISAAEAIQLLRCLDVVAGSVTEQPVKVYDMCFPVHPADTMEAGRSAIRMIKWFMSAIGTSYQYFSSSEQRNAMA